MTRKTLLNSPELVLSRSSLNAAGDGTARRPEGFGIIMIRSLYFNKQRFEIRQEQSLQSMTFSQISDCDHTPSNIFLSKWYGGAPRGQLSIQLRPPRLLTWRLIASYASLELFVARMMILTYWDQCLSPMIRFSNGIIMIPPFGFFRILAAGFNVKRIVGRSFLFFARWKHWDYGKADCLHRKSWRPIFCQYGQTNMSIGINMRVHRDIGSNERHLGRIEGILGGEFEEQLEFFSFVQRSVGAFHVDDPLCETVPMQGVRIDWDTRWRLPLHWHELFLESFI